MKRKLSLAVIAMSLLTLTTSCLKDGINDFEGLRHPLQLQGSFDPHLGIPIGSASITVGDLLGMFQETSGYIQLDPTTGVATVTYDTSFTNTYEFGNKKAKTTPNRRKADNGFHQMVEGEVDFDIFSNLQQLPSNFKVDNLFVTLFADVVAHCSEQTESLLQDYDVKVFLDQIQLSASNHNGQQYVLPMEEDTVMVNNLIAGDRVMIIDQANIAEVINIKPTKIHYQARLNIDLGSQFWASDISQFVLDSLEISSIDLTSNIAAHFPLTVYFDDANFLTEMDIALGEQEILDNLVMDSSELVLELENSLPLQILLGAKLLDVNNNELGTLFNDPYVTIGGAQIGFNSTVGNYVVTGATKSVIRIPVNSSNIEALTKASKISLDTHLATASDPTGTEPQPMVSILGSDALRVRLYAQLHPTVNVAIPLSSK